MKKTNPYGHGLTRQICLPQATANSVSQVGERLSDQLWCGIPPSEGGLGTHGFRLGRCRNCSHIHVGRESGQFCPGCLPEQAPQDWAAGLGQLSDGVDSGFMEAPFRRWSDAPYQPDWEGIEKVFLFVRIHGDETVRLGYL